MTFLFWTTKNYGFNMFCFYIYVYPVGCCAKCVQTSVQIFCLGQHFGEERSAAKSAGRLGGGRAEGACLCSVRVNVKRENDRREKEGRQGEDRRRELIREERCEGWDEMMHKPPVTPTTPTTQGPRIAFLQDFFRPIPKNSSSALLLSKFLGFIPTSTYPVPIDESLTRMSPGRHSEFCLVLLQSFTEMFLGRIPKSTTQELMFSERFSEICLNLLQSLTRIINGRFYVFHDAVLSQSLTEMFNGVPSQTTTQQTETTPPVTAVSNIHDHVLVRLAATALLLCL